MSRAETLAGLTEAIADEILERAAPRETELGEFEEPQASYGPGFIADLSCELDVKALAAVALAWLEGHGWAEGDVQDVHLPRIPHSTRTLRGVTTPVETGDAP